MAKKGKQDSHLGAWAFLIGVIIALGSAIFGLEVTSGNWGIAMVVIGVIIGLFNISGEEARDFMLSGAVLVIVSTLGGGVLNQIGWLERFINALTVLFVPATIVVSIRALWGIGRA